jgi:hypothetical protein
MTPSDGIRADSGCHGRSGCRSFVTGSLSALPGPADREASDSANMKEGRPGTTSGKEAALCHERAKLSILFTPPAFRKRVEIEEVLDV